MVRVFRQKHDYEASSVEIEADRISKPEKFRRSSDHNALRVDAGGDVRIAIRGQYPNKGKKELRPDVGTDIRGDEFTIDARKIVKQKPRGKRDVATASKFVRIFRRSRRCPNHRIAPYRPA